VAVSNGRTQIVEVLVEAGADLNYMDYDGRTPLDMVPVYDSDDHTDRNYDETPTQIISILAQEWQLLISHLRARKMHLGMQQHLLHTAGFRKGL
jgi:ankyrin repeat protein